MRLRVLGAALFIAGLASAKSAAATVTYTFSSPTDSVSFNYFTANFLTQSTTVAASDLQSCSIEGFSCEQVTFNEPHDMFPASISVVGDNLSSFAGYVSAPGFDTPGTYQVLGGLGGSFTISLAAVPEPATWAMMLLGFGAIGAAFRIKGKRLIVAAQRLLPTNSCH